MNCKVCIGPPATTYTPDCGVFIAHKAELRVEKEKQTAEMKENAVLREKALLQQRLHDQDIQRLEQERVNGRSTLSSFIVLLFLTPDGDPGWRIRSLH